MKTIFVFILLVFFVFVYNSCSKTNSGKSGIYQILGRWNILTDSFPAGGPSMSHFETYTGRDGDYFDFDTDSNLYIKEGNHYTTSAYHITSDSTITIADYFEGNNYPVTYDVTNLTRHTVTIAIPWLYSPGGILGRIVHLSR